MLAFYEHVADRCWYCEDDLAWPAFDDVKAATDTLADIEIFRGPVWQDPYPVRIFDALLDLEEYTCLRAAARDASCPAVKRRLEGMMKDVYEKGALLGNSKTLFSIIEMLQCVVFTV